MREILFFVITMITVMMASTMGTVRLVRSAHQGHLKRSWAKTGLWILGLTLPIAVPAAMGAIFLQVLQLLAKSKGFPIHGVEAVYFNITFLATIVAAYVLCLLGTLNGIRRLPPVQH